MRNLLKLLFSRANQADQNVPVVYVDRQPIVINLTALIATDEAERKKQKTADAPKTTTHLVDQNDEFVLMEYEDASGNQTRRRITIHQTSNENGLFYLKAFCHERRAVRTFRADRAQSFITADGEIIPGRKFLIEQMGIDVGDGKPTLDRQAILLRRIKDQLRDPLTVLIGLAKCDGHIHVEELDCIQVFAEREILSRNEPHIFENIPMLSTLDGLCNSIGMMRPRAPTIATAVSRLYKMDAPQLDNFFRTAQKVIRADGRVASEEIDFLEELRWLCDSDVAERLVAIREAMEFAQA